MAGLFPLSPISSFSLFAIREIRRKVICQWLFLRDGITRFPVLVCTWQSIFPLKKKKEEKKVVSFFLFLFFCSVSPCPLVSCSTCVFSPEHSHLKHHVVRQFKLVHIYLTDKILGQISKTTLSASLQECWKQISWSSTDPYTICMWYIHKTLQIFYIDL